MPLSECPVGAEARVLTVEVDAAQRRRLLDLGLVPGTRISVESRSPLGDPTAYLVLGATVALRREQSERILVELVRPAPENRNQV
jgi:ferrous iron transport protein A